MYFRFYGKYFFFDRVCTDEDEVNRIIANSKRAYKIKDADKKDTWIQRRITKVVGEEGQIIYC
jgi:hypothetical protein